MRVGRFPFVANGKAIALGEDQGLVKAIFDKKTGQLLGAHLVGAEVTELIQGFVVAMNLETTEEELFHTIFPHPTISETMKESRAGRLRARVEYVMLFSLFFFSSFISLIFLYYISIFLIFGRLQGGFFFFIFFYPAGRPTWLP